MSVTVPTNAEFTALKTSVTALQAQVAGDETRLTSVESALQLLTARVVALEAVPPPAPPPAPPPSGTPPLIFSSDWASGVVKDTWDTYDEFNNGSGVILAHVLPGFGPGGANALQVKQAGDPPGYAVNLQKAGILAPGQDFWVRYYFRTDDTSGAGDHCTTCNFYQYDNLTFLRKMGGPTSWRYITSCYGVPISPPQNANYPVGHWSLRDRLQNGIWYRLEDGVHWIDGTHIQVHKRVYDLNGTLLYGDADFQQQDYGQSGNLSFGGRADWTLASFYAAGYSFGVHPLALADFAIGNNGQQGATATGLSWYYAKVGISTVGWVGV